jgi:hypothetical protein
MVASLIIFLAGGWLILAPFALGYQPSGADWTNQTVNDFVVGICVAVVALATFVLFFYGLLGSLRASGVIAARTHVQPVPEIPAQYARPVAASQASASNQSDLDRTLATLAAALAADMAARRGSNDQQPNSLVEPTIERREV